MVELHPKKYRPKTNSAMKTGRPNRKTKVIPLSFGLNLWQTIGVVFLAAIAQAVLFGMCSRALKASLLRW